MRWIPRLIEAELMRTASDFPASILTGPRRAGKTALLRRLHPRASYVLLEDPETLGRVRDDPRAFMEGLRHPVILDEIQNAPELFRWVRADVDRQRSRRVRWLVTGSQEAPLMQGVTESMAGRAAVFQLLPLARAESPRVTLLKGGFPEVLARPATWRTWYRSYVQTYLERDVRAVTAVRDLATFRRFLGLLASRCGQVLNKTDLAAPLGVSVPTITQWLGVLETTGEILLVQPYFESFGKRLIKSPRVYFVDPGLACHLLGVESERELARSPFLGPVFEGFVASEIAKLQAGRGVRREIYYFRDQQGLEVDLVVPLGAGSLALVEAKASVTVRPAMADPMLRLAASIGRDDVRCLVVHRRGDTSPPTRALRPGVEAIDVAELASVFGRATRG